MRKEDFIDLLTKIGFTQYSAKAYHALVQLKQASAPDISAVSGVPKAKIYEALDDLYKKGFVGKIEDSKPAKYFAYNPAEKINSWLGQFVELGEYLESIYDTKEESLSEYGVRSLGDYKGKFLASDFNYIFDQSEDLYERFFEGKILNYYRLAPQKGRMSLVAVSKKKTIVLEDHSDRVQLIVLETDVFLRIIDAVMNLSPVNRAITTEMMELSKGEEIIFVDSVLSASGYVFGQYGTIWLSRGRLFIHIPNKPVYARPFSVIDKCEVSSEGSLELSIKRKDGILENIQLFTYSDPKIIQSLVMLMKSRKTDK
ncbi:MAG: TrmB family transcriptional regulator [Candidatus Heimdallarchaeaceae archaeon]